MKLRIPKFHYEGVTNHWFAGSVLITHLSNVFHSTIPAGERFIIRALARLKDRLPPEEQGPVKIFLAQEGQHAAAHDSFSKVLASQGYDPGGLAKAHDRAYAWLERGLPLIFRLSIAPGVEHYTAILGDEFLAGQDQLTGIQPGVRNLLLWHAAEEVEHRSVIFDALKRLNSSHVLRAVGFLLATVVLQLSTVYSFFHFLRRDPERPWLRLLSELAVALFVFPHLRIALRTLEYLRPGFHPSQRGETARAVEFLTELEARTSRLTAVRDFGAREDKGLGVGDRNLLVSQA